MGGECVCLYRVCVSPPGSCRSYGVCSTSMAPMEMGHTFNKSFKKRKSLALRKQEVVGIRTKFPNKIPVIVERFGKEQDLPLLDKTKFLVPQELTMSQFVTIIRRNLASMSSRMAELYAEHQDEDGFLYVTYASQEMFGSVGRTTE